MRILIIQTAFIGDLILTLPLIQTLKKNIPDSTIDLLCIPYTKEVVKNNPYISNVIVFDKHKKKSIKDIIYLANNLKKEKYEYAFLPHRSIRSGLIAMLSKIENRIGFKKTLFDFLYTKSVEYQSDIHEIDRNLSLIKFLKFKEIYRIPELFPDDSDKFFVNDFLDNNNIVEKFVCIAPGSKWFTKRWPIDYFIELIKMFNNENIKVILIGGKEDSDICNSITIEINNIINTSGIFSLLQTAELIKRSSLLISNDSAPIHIATSMNTPVIDIYGPTTPEIGFYPLSEKSISIEIKDLNCRPCKIHGGNKCPVRTFDCMKNILPENIFRAAMEMLKI